MLLLQAVIGVVIGDLYLTILVSVSFILGKNVWNTSKLSQHERSISPRQSCFTCIRVEWLEAYLSDYYDSTYDYDFKYISSVSSQRCRYLF